MCLHFLVKSLSYEELLVVQGCWTSCDIGEKYPYDKVESCGHSSHAEGCLTNCSLAQHDSTLNPFKLPKGKPCISGLKETDRKPKGKPRLFFLGGSPKKPEPLNWLHSKLPWKPRPLLGRLCRATHAMTSAGNAQGAKRGSQMSSQDHAC